MAVKTSKPQKQSRPAEANATRRQKTAQVIFAVFAILLIVSMVLSAVATY